MSVCLNVLQQFEFKDTKALLEHVVLNNLLSKEAARNYKTIREQGLIHGLVNYLNYVVLGAVMCRGRYTSGINLGRLDGELSNSKIIDYAKDYN
jgi:hypothetical protein